MRIILPHEYTAKEKEVIRKYNLGHLTQKERHLIYYHDGIEEKAKIVLAYRDSLSLWADEERRFAQGNKSK